MGSRKCASCTAKTSHCMRSLVALNCATGLALIVFAGCIEKPINSFPAVAMVLLGVLCWVSAVVGLVGGHKYTSCLTVFLVMHGFNVFMQGILVILLHTDLDGVLAIIKPPQVEGQYGHAGVRHTLNAERWLMLVFLLLEIIIFGLAVALRYWLDPDPHNIYTNFDPATQQERTLDMQALRTDVEAGRTMYSSGSNSVYDKLRNKMQAKYGQFTEGFSFKPSKLLKAASLPLSRVPSLLPKVPSILSSLRL